MKIIRNRHPLQGKYLDVLGWHHREDILHLTLVLPDGSRSFIPATWTNLQEICPEKFPFPVKKSQADLTATATTFLHVCKIVDSLLGKIPSLEQKSRTASREENNHAKTVELLADTKRDLSNSSDLGISRPPTTKPGNHGSGSPGSKNSLPKGSKTDQGGKQ